mgnify:CR=1 FL=1
MLGAAGASSLSNGFADRFGKREREISGVRISDAFLIGVAQALALIPGTSRSGVTITAGRLLGFERQDAARFSFLLSSPAILLATAYAMLRLLRSGDAVAWLELGAGALVSLIVAYLHKSRGTIEMEPGLLNLFPFARIDEIKAGIRALAGDSALFSRFLTVRRHGPGAAGLAVARLGLRMLRAEA